MAADFTPHQCELIRNAERHPIRAFVFDEWLTSGRTIGFLAVGAFAAVVTGAANPGTRWPLFVLAALMLVQVVRNWRRFRERVFHMAADMDRPAGAGPIHPDADAQARAERPDDGRAP